jgi:hypothetical protein
MKFDLPPTRITETVRSQAVGRKVAASSRCGSGYRAKTKGEGAMQAEAGAGRVESVRPHSLAELLECPLDTGNLLSGSAQCLSFDAGQVVFHQSDICRGLYLVLSGQFIRRSERLATRLTLSSARVGELVELAAVLGDGHHTCSLAAQSAGSVLLFPIDALTQAFQSYPVLRMRLLEELAREVSCAYRTCCLSRSVRRRGGAPSE